MLSLAMYNIYIYIYYNKYPISLSFCHEHPQLVKTISCVALQIKEQGWSKDHVPSYLDELHIDSRPHACVAFQSPYSR